MKEYARACSRARARAAGVAERSVLRFRVKERKGRLNHGENAIVTRDRIAETKMTELELAPKATLEAVRNC